MTEETALANVPTGHSEAEGEAGMLARLESIALDSRLDPERLERLYALYMDMKARSALKQYNIAMNAAQTEIEPVVRADKGDKHLYAKLERIDRKIRPIYTKHGFALSENTVVPLKPGNIRIECLCQHVSGHVERFYREGAPDMLGPKGAPVKTELHGIGSTETFLRRYLRVGIFNVVFEDLDDDGNGGPISEEEVDQILSKLEGAKIKATGFLQYMRLPSSTLEIIRMIPKSDLGKALNAVDALVKKATENG